MAKTKKTEVKRPIEELVAADDLVQSLTDRADARNSIYPLWHGWALREAFLAGIDYARSHPGDE